jgi:hypothetical protein
LASWHRGLCGRSTRAASDPWWRRGDGLRSSGGQRQWAAVSPLQPPQ